MDELERRPVGGVSSRDRTSAVVRPDEHGVPDRLLAEVAIEAASLGTFTWDLRSDRISWDARMLELFGYAPGEFDGRLHSFDARVDPRDLPGVHEELSRVIAEGGRFTLTYRVAVPGTDGRRWVTARGRAISGLTASPRPWWGPRSTPPPSARSPITSQASSSRSPPPSSPSTASGV